MDCSILIKNQIVLYSSEDADLFENCKWRIGTGNYVMRGERHGYKGKYLNIYFHKMVGERMGLDTINLFVDHINRNKLDNRRSNLRSATWSQNNANSNKPRNKTGYKGVYPSKKRWYANIQVNKVPIYIGSFKTPIEAALAYDEAAIKYFGEFASLNFPNKKVRL